MKKPELSLDPKVRREENESGADTFIDSLRSSLFGVVGDIVKKHSESDLGALVGYVLASQKEKINLEELFNAIVLGISKVEGTQEDQSQTSKIIGGAPEEIILRR
jgi:hypothetical protein